ncbi:MAG: tetratricopeptide repeat protein, partial [Chthoniobacterales bacterium]
MKRAFFIAVMAAWPAWGVAQSADVQTQAESALRNGVPHTAIAPLKEALRKGQGDRTALSLLLARLQLAAGSPEDALKTLDNGGTSGNEEWKVLRGAALAAEGGNSAAAKLLAPIAPTNAEAALLLARLRAEQGDNQAATEILSKVGAEASANPQTLRLILDVKLSAGDTAAAAELLQKLETEGLLPPAETGVAKGRLLLAQGKPAEAAEAFQSALSSPEIPPQVRDNARLGLARSASALGDATKARAVLREGLSAGTTSAALRRTMEEWIALEKAAAADPSGDLRTWSAEKKGMRAAEAALQLAQLDLETRATEAAAKSMQELLAREDLEPEQRKRAELLVVETKIAAGQSSEALAALDSMAAEDDYGKLMLRGRALAASGANRQAQDVFAEAAKSGGTPGAISAAAANRFITALATGDLALAREAWQALQTPAANDPRLLEGSFLMASAEAQQGTTDSLAALARRTPATDYS